MSYEQSLFCQKVQITSFSYNFYLISRFFYKLFSPIRKLFLIPERVTLYLIVLPVAIHLINVQLASNYYCEKFNYVSGKAINCYFLTQTISVVSYVSCRRHTSKHVAALNQYFHSLAYLSTLLYIRG